MRLRLIPAGLAVLAAVPAWCGVIPGEVLVRFRPEVPPAAARRALEEMGGREAGGVPRLRVKRVTLPPGLSVDEAVARLARRPGVEFAEANQYRFPAALPNDPYLAQGDQWALEKIRLAAAWAENVPGARGPAAGSIKIAVLDTGVRICSAQTDPELGGRLAPQADWYNALEANGNVNDLDPSGHGTFVAGEIAALTGNADGIAGMVWQGALVMPVKIIGDARQGDATALANGLIWAADHGARVVNLSVQSCDEWGDCPYVGTATELDAVEYAHRAGAILVAAAGNASSTSPSWPAAYPYVLGVSATGPDDALAAYSNRGDYVDLAAPGGTTLLGDGTDRILGLSNVSCNGALSDYRLLAGTSMAAPLVTGLAALLAAAYPASTNDQIVSLMTRTADQVEGAGWNPRYGYGRINVYRALTAGFTVPPAAAGTDADAYAYPNPFSPRADRHTTFVVRPRAGEGVRIRIHDPQGALVWETALTAAEAAGTDLFFNSPLRWAGTDDGGRALANGVYLARVELGNRVFVKRIAIRR